MGMADSKLWRITVRLFLLAWTWVAMALIQACTIATAARMDSPFNIRR